MRRRSCSRSPVDPPTSSSISSDHTTCLYQTPLGVAALTWRRAFAGRTLSIDLHLHRSSAAVSFRIRLSPWLFWNKRGSKKFRLDGRGGAALLSWDLSSAASHSSGGEPTSSFCIAVVVDEETVLLAGDSACARTKSQEPLAAPPSHLLMRRENVLIAGSRIYSSRTTFGGKNRDISIDFAAGGEPSLAFVVDGTRALEVKHLQWKFRGNERFEVEGFPVQVSWDVRCLLFDSASAAGHAVFLFKFEGEDRTAGVSENCNPRGMVSWPQPFELEESKLKKRLLKTKSSSSSSSSTSSSRGSSSVAEWSSVEEDELLSSRGFSLLVYARKR